MSTADWDTHELLAKRVQIVVNELSHEKSNLTTILSNMTEAVVAVDPAGRITAVNAALSRLFEVSPEESKGKIFLEALRQNQ